MMRVLSDVFPPHIKPVRDGWYLLAFAVGEIFEFREYRGGRWRFSGGESISWRACGEWRGLAFCPHSAIATTHTDVSIASQRVYEIEGVFVPGATICE